MTSDITRAVRRARDAERGIVRPENCVVILSESEHRLIERGEHEGAGDE